MLAEALSDPLFERAHVLPDAQRFVDWLRERAIAVRLVTNNATLTPAQYVEKLDRMGISVREAEVFTSALATGMYLQQHASPGQSVLVVGEDGLTRVPPPRRR